MSGQFFEQLLTSERERSDGVCFELYRADGAHKTLTFGHMARRVAETAGLLASHGVATGDIVLIFAQHSEGMLLAFFGAQWLGAIPAFMPPPTIKQDSIAWSRSHRQLIDRIQPRVVVSEPSCIDHVRSLCVQSVVSTDDIELHRTDYRPALHESSLDDIAFLQHSSGTTGLKKGVTVTYRQLLAQLDSYGDSIGIGDDCNIVSWLPIYHDMGLIAATLLPLYRGTSVRLIDTFAWLSDPGCIVALWARFPNVYTWLPNFAFNYLAKRARFEIPDQALAGVRAIINCSEPCKEDDMLAFKERFVPYGLAGTAVQVCYAAAEYVFAMTQTRKGEPIHPLVVDAEKFEMEGAIVPLHGNRPGRSIVPVGTPLPETEIRIVGGAGGRVGEIAIRGPSLCSGYFRNEKITREKFNEGWYHTGDLGFIHDGIVYVTGRIDDLIIVRGKNIYAHDVEAIATSVTGVKDGRATAFGVEDVSGTQQLVLVVESTGDVSSRTLKTDLNDRVNDVFGIVPGDTVVVQPHTLVKTTSGKISRSENRKKYLNKALSVSAAS